MSNPVLLVVTADSCAMCQRITIHRRHLNDEVKKVSPNIRIVWLCLDDCESSEILLPLSVQSVPLCVLFPEGIWESHTGSGILGKRYTKGVLDMSNYTETITSWLRDKIRESEGDRHVEKDILSPKTGDRKGGVERKVGITRERRKYGSLKHRECGPMKDARKPRAMEQEKGSVKYSLTWSLEDGLELEIGSGDVRFCASFDIKKFLTGRMNMAIS